MSRWSDDDDYDEAFPKALADLRDALNALPEKRLIEGAVCTVRALDKIDPALDPYGYGREDAQDKLTEQGEGVCAVGAYVWWQRVKAGATPDEAFDALPILPDTDSGLDDTARLGKEAGLVYSLASHLAYRNDETYCGMSPEQRYEAFMRWIDQQLGDDTAERTAT